MVLLYIFGTCNHHVFLKILRAQRPRGPSVIASLVRSRQEASARSPDYEMWEWATEGVGGREGHPLKVQTAPLSESI